MLPNSEGVTCLLSEAPLQGALSHHPVHSRGHHFRRSEI